MSAFDATIACSASACLHGRSLLGHEHADQSVPRSIATAYVPFVPVYEPHTRSRVTSMPSALQRFGYAIACAAGVISGGVRRRGVRQRLCGSAFALTCAATLATAASPFGERRLFDTSSSSSRGR